ncbi:MAG: hypothetical protein DMG96_02860 [Acidobacteria bacterium]|nr:MAG: hypothetical protein DMG96_02860 [Acidobacteriota bacterium]
MALTISYLRTMSSGVGVLLLLAPCIALAESPSETRISPSDLVKAVIYNELHPPINSDVRWKYRLDKEVTGKQETREVIETKSGSLDRLLLVAGKPLSGAQASDESERILRFSHSPEDQRKAEQARRKDAEQCNGLLRMIPDAFVFEYAGESGTLTRVTFKPNPRFRPPSREGKVLQQMVGEMWVDARQKRLASINGQLINEVKFGGGLLGHLEKGGQFTVQRAELAPGVWEVTDMTVNMRGRALLFKSICVQQKERHSNFERVADDLSLADAANLLLRQTLVAAKQ